MRARRFKVLVNGKPLIFGVDGDTSCALTIDSTRRHSKMFSSHKIKIKYLGRI